MGIPVVRPATTETTAAGAAFLAGLAVDFWSGIEELSELWEREKTFEPNMKEPERERLLSEWRRAVGRATNWVNGA